MNEVMKLFKRRVKVMASYVKDEGGFIIASLVEDSLINDLCNKKIIALYTAIEYYTEKVLN